MSNPDTLKKPWLSSTAWKRIKLGAMIVGTVAGTIAVCAVSTFACAYAHGYGNSRGWKNGGARNPSSPGSPGSSLFGSSSERSSSVPIGSSNSGYSGGSSGFRRNFDIGEAA